MADPTLLAPLESARPRRGRRRVVLAAALLLATVSVADAKITIRRHAPHDNFFFHGNYSTEPFTPASAFRIEIWNCADGAAPTFLTGREVRVVCALDPTGNNHVFGELVYAADVPAGTCNDHGSSCYYRDASIPRTGPGIRYFRVRYARHGRRNRVWLESYGDLSAAVHARMLLLIKVDGQPRAVLETTFTPLPNGGWFSPF